MNDKSPLITTLREKSLNKNGHSEKNGRDGNGNGKNSHSPISLVEETETAASKESRPVPGSLKAQLRQLLLVAKAVRQGDFSVRFPVMEGAVGDKGNP